MEETVAGHFRKMAIFHLAVLLGLYQVVAALTPEVLVDRAREHVGETKWAFRSFYSIRYRWGSWKCNLFVYDVLIEAGANVPSRHRRIYSPISAAEWSDPDSPVLKDAECWTLCPQDSPILGDIVGDGGHVAIVSGDRKTISADEILVVENDFGFRFQNQISACWRYKYDNPSC